MDCSTIIVSYNTFEFTTEAVRTALLAGDGLSQEVIVVDNNSPDESGRRLRERYPDGDGTSVRIVQSSENLGFTRGNNEGARIARGRVLLFLNPDTEVHGAAVRILHDFLLDHPEAGAVGPHVRNSDGTTQRSTSSFVSAGTLFRHYLPFGALLGRRAGAPEDRGVTSRVDVVSGCALALRREVFDRVGGWDESYFMYSEESELCHALARSGFTNFVVPAAEITHHGGASSADRHAEQQVVQARSALQFMRRHNPDLVLLNRVLGTLGFGARSVAYALLARLDSSATHDYRRRSAAASALFRWFLLRYE